MTDSMTQVHDNQKRLEDVLASYLEACDAGWAPNREQLLAAYPDLRKDLLEFFQGYDDVHTLTSPFRGSDDTPSPGAEPSRSISSTTATLPMTAEASSLWNELTESKRFFATYELLSEVARGGMGVVFKARQLSYDKRIVALKMIRSGHLATEQEIQRFQFEAEIAAQLDHPHVVPIYEVGKHNEQHYFTMKLIEGGSLKERMPHYREALDDAVQLLSKVARAVHYAHRRGILHRDLKPSNILIDVDGEPWVTDFGLAKRLTSDAGLTASNAIVGTPNYMAPEQTLGSRIILTTSADVYSIGSMLYEMLAGRTPFESDNVLDTLSLLRDQVPKPPREINPEIDVDLNRICMKCLEKAPSKRYVSAEDLAEDLENWRAGLAPVTPARPRKRVLGRRFMITAGVLGTCIVAFAALMILQYQKVQERIADIQDRQARQKRADDRRDQDPFSQVGSPPGRASDGPPKRARSIPAPKNEGEVSLRVYVPNGKSVADGDFVHLVWKGPAWGKTIERILLRNVKVAHVGEIAKSDDAQRYDVTLRVKPNEGRLLSAARTTGELSMHPKDPETIVNEDHKDLTDEELNRLLADVTDKEPVPLPPTTPPTTSVAGTETPCPTSPYDVQAVPAMPRAPLSEDRDDSTMQYVTVTGYSGKTALTVKVQKPFAYLDQREDGGTTRYYLYRRAGGRVSVSDEPLKAYSMPDSGKLQTVRVMPSADEVRMMPGRRIARQMPPAEPWLVDDSFSGTASGIIGGAAAGASIIGQ